MRRFRQDDKPFIDISDRPLDDTRPVGPFFGCQGGNGGSESTVPTTMGLTVDVDDRLYTDDTDPDHFEVVRGKMMEHIGSRFDRSDLELEETRVGDVRVRIGIENKTIKDVRWLEDHIDMIEQDDDVVNIYDVRLEG